MNLTKNINRILWHEIGHFCIDIQKVKYHSDYCVNKIKIAYKRRNDDLIPWYGYVEMLPTTKWELIPKDPSFMAYSLISLISGCLFETIYLTEILKESRELKDCFSFTKNAVGRGDFNSYHEILTQTRKLHEYLRGKNDFNNFIEFEFKNIVTDKIYKIEEFFVALKKIIDPIAIDIEKDYLIKNSSSPYEFEIIGKYLESIKNEILEISKQAGFSNLIEELREHFIEQYQHYITKYKVEIE